MKDTESLHLLVDLVDACCELNHGPQVKRTSKAVDYVAVNLGYAGQDPDDKLVIPICSECAEALSDDEWTLIYCLECNSSQWINQTRSKLDYTNKETGKHHHIVGVIGCPECSGKLTGLYFLD